MLEPEQVTELKARLEHLGTIHNQETHEMVKDLRRDFDLMVDMHNTPERTALEERFIKGLLYAESSVKK
jgi:hypothetical protein